MITARVTILTKLRGFFAEMKDEELPAVFVNAMQAELKRLCGAAPQASNPLEPLDLLYRLYTDLPDEEPSVSFTYAMLSELALLVSMREADESRPPEAVIQAYFFIADEYRVLGHYLFAGDYYLKALEAFLKCSGDIFEDVKMTAAFDRGCVNLLEIYRNRGESEAADKLYARIFGAFPERCEAIRRRAAEELRLECDPVEYTDEYLAVLPELEAKIEAELGDLTVGEGFCFAYWSMKEKILLRDYGISWDWPSSLNPEVMFD